MDAAFEDITADHCRGCVRHSRIFLWQWKTSDVMLMKMFGLTNKSDRMSNKNSFFHGCYFVFLCIWGNTRNMKCTVIGELDKQDFTLHVIHSYKNKCIV